MKHFTDQIEDGRTPRSKLKKTDLRYSAAIIHLSQSEVHVQREFKQVCIHDASMYI